MNLNSSSVFLSPPCLFFFQLFPFVPLLVWLQTWGLMSATFRSSHLIFAIIFIILKSLGLFFPLLPVRFCGNTLQPHFISHQPTLPSCLSLWWLLLGNPPRECFQHHESSAALLHFHIQERSHRYRSSKEASRVLSGFCSDDREIREKFTQRLQFDMILSDSGGLNKFSKESDKVLCSSSRPSSERMWSKMLDSRFSVILTDILIWF